MQSGVRVSPHNQLVIAIEDMITGALVVSVPEAVIRIAVAGRITLFTGHPNGPAADLT
jgi:hypothetical protein